MEETLRSVNLHNAVLQLILEGFTRREVVLRLKNGTLPGFSETMSERAAYNYYKRAQEMMNNDVENFQEYLIPDLITKYMFIYKRSIGRDNANSDWLAKGVLDALVKLLKLEEKLSASGVELDREALEEQVVRMCKEVNFKEVFDTVLQSPVIPSNPDKDND